MKVSVIEIDPWDYLKNEYSSSDYSKKDKNEFWFKYISDSGLKNFKDVFDKHKFSKSEFRSQIKLAHKNQEEFQKKIFIVFIDMKIQMKL